MDRCRSWVNSRLVRLTETEAKELLVRLKLFLVNWMDITQTWATSQGQGQKLEQEGLRLKLQPRSSTHRDHFHLLFMC